MKTYITELFTEHQLLRGDSVGYINIIENGIGNSRGKAVQVKSEESFLGRKLKDDIVSELEIDVKKRSHKIQQIQLRPGIAVWGKKTDKLLNLIEKYNIAYAININKIPEIRKNAAREIYQECLDKLKPYNIDSEIKFLKNEVFFRDEINTDLLYKIILGRKHRITGDIRGFIAEVMSKYIFSTNSTGLLKITPNVCIEYECATFNGEKTYLGRQKEFDFILASTEVDDLKNFLTNLQNNNIEVIKNKQYVPTIINI